jgi:gamma-glutamylcyclotransferase (GGCT)/AIG2-like uncharacterized protein YtfP
VTAAPSLDNQTSDEMTRLFVYGGLMKGFDLHHHMAGCVFLASAWTPGILVQVGRYPGLLDGSGNVSGELYSMNDAPAILEALDELEEFDPTNPQASAYVRVMREVSFGDGSTTRAWVYLYNGDASGLTVVQSGDWRSTMKRI